MSLCVLKFAPFRSVLLVMVSAAVALSQTAPNRYALILEDPPVAERFASRETTRSVAAQSYQKQIAAKQRALRGELDTHHIVITGSADTLLNAVFVTATKDRIAELKSMPGVKGVVALRRYTPSLNRATLLMNGPGAWNALGGIQNAGAGMKIGILDTGIDQTHPAFQDSSLPMPAGYPICSGSDCAFTTNKVIVARSYVRQVAAGSSPDPTVDSRPDDYSARDRSGHGTAVASAAAAFITSAAVTFSGMAPRAYLGSYKIYGSPEVNDSTTDDVIVQAIEDAFKDGMDVASFSSGGAPFSGPLDTGALCGNDAGVPCDLVAVTFENSVKAGMVVVASAGNSGEDGLNFPTFGSVASPANAPSVIAAGATSNSHFFAGAVSVPGGPANLQGILADPGDSFGGAITGPVRDVTATGDTGLACAALPAQSLAGYIALVERGTCNFSTKIINAYAAGAIGVIFYMADSSALISPSGLNSAPIPGVIVSNADGLILKSYAAANPGFTATLDPSGKEVDDSAHANELVSFSSFGPGIGTSSLKPDLVATGESMYMAAERYDPLGELYSPNGYAVADGTSFAAPLTSGAAALVKQKHPNFTALQIRSALMNSASQDVTVDDQGDPVNVQWIGAGKLDAGAAVNAVLTSVPASISFGGITSLPLSQQLQLTNTGSAPLNLSIANAPGTPTGGASIAFDKTTLSLAAGGTGNVTVTLSGSTPAAGSYSGAVTIQASGVSIRVPYLYLVSSGTVSNLVPLSGDGFDGTVGQGISVGIISFRLVDAFGIPVANAPVSFSARGGGSLHFADTRTNNFGIALAQPVLGSQPGNYSFIGIGGGLRHTFSGFARAQPTIAANGVVNAASFDGTIAPGSYITLFGTGLSDATDPTTTARLPMAIDFANVAFDVPSAGISVPGHLIYVSPTQVNVQVPWELQGQAFAFVKVNVDYSNGNVITVPLAAYAPAFFEIGGGNVAALDVKFGVIGAGNPALRGQVVQLYVNGLGPVSNQPASGDVALSSPLSQTTSVPAVTIDGQVAQVVFSGLAPGFPALYQVNVVIPTSVTPGTYPITISIGGSTSKASNIVVK